MHLARLLANAVATVVNNNGIRDQNFNAVLHDATIVMMIDDRAEYDQRLIRRCNNASSILGKQTILDCEMTCRLKRGSGIIDQTRLHQLQRTVGGPQLNRTTGVPYKSAFVNNNRDAIVGVDREATIITKDASAEMSVSRTVDTNNVGSCVEKLAVVTSDARRTACIHDQPIRSSKAQTAKLNM